MQRSRRSSVPSNNLREQLLRTPATTDLVVTRFGRGTVAPGPDYGIPIQGETLRPNTTDAAWLLQSAPATARESEEIIGAAIGHRRSEYVLCTTSFSSSRA